MAGFIPGFPLKLNFDGLSPVTIHFQPSSFVLFDAGGAVSSLLLASEYSVALSSEMSSLSLSLSLRKCFHFLKKHCHLHFRFLVACVQFDLQTRNAFYNSHFYGRVGLGIT